MPNALAKIRTRAKAIRKSHGGSYQTALKRAGREYREGKVSGKRKTTRPKKVTGKTYRPVQVEHCTPSGTIGAVNKAKHALKERLGFMLATQVTAKTKREKKALAPKIAELKKQLRALS